MVGSHERAIDDRADLAARAAVRAWLLGAAGPAVALGGRPPDHACGATVVLALPATRGADPFTTPTVRADARRLPFATASFDRGWALGLLAGSTGHARAVEETARILRPDAPIALLDFISTGRSWNDTRSGHRFLSRVRIDALLAQGGFHVDRIVVTEHVGTRGAGAASDPSVPDETPGHRTFGGELIGCYRAPARGPRSVAGAERIATLVRTGAIEPSVAFAHRAP
jgi:SAM-dependent methyltransferase